MKTITEYFLACMLGLFFVLSPRTSAATQVKGTVTDVSGRPVEGAEVQFYAAVEGYGPRELKLDATAITDAKGGFELTVSVPHVVVVARKPGFACSWIEVDQRPTEPIRLTLTQPASVAGRVVDEAGKPVAGAEVHTVGAYSSAPTTRGTGRFYYLAGTPVRQLYKTTTGDDGRFRLEGFPTDATVNLAAYAADKATPNEESQVIDPRLMQCPAGAEDVELLVQATGSVEGKIVTSEPSGPLPVARLVLESGPLVQGDSAFGLSLSKEDGSFLITNVPAGSYKLHAIFGTNAVPEWVAEAVPVSVEPGRATRGVEIKATRGGVLAVSVVDEKDRKPVAEVPLLVQSPNFRVWSHTDDKGAQRLRLPAGQFGLLAYQYGTWARNIQVTVEEGKTNHVEVEMPAPVKIAGIVRKPDGQPAANLEVWVISSHGVPAEKGVTDASGRFEIETRLTEYDTARNYCVLARDLQNNLAAAIDVEEPTNTLQLALSPAVSFAGRVESNGQPVTNHKAALIFWVGDGGTSIAELATNAVTPGGFEIPALPTGRRYGLIVSAPGHGQHSNFQLPSDEPGRVQLDPIELKPANLKLAGVVLDAEDKPVSGAMVQLHGDPQPSAVARTDRKGRFTFSQVCEGKAMLTASLTGVYSSSFGNATTEGGNTNVVIKLGDSAAGTVSRKLAGIVTDPEGKPVAGAEVVVHPSNVRQTAKTDTNGRYNLTYYLDQWVLNSGEAPCLVVTHRERNLAVAENIEEGITNLDVRLKPALKLVGRVENATGGPITNAQVRTWLIAGRTWNAVNEAPVSADTNGTFEIAGLPLGPRYMFRASAPGHGMDEQQLESESQTNYVELPPFVLKVADKLVAGQVVDEKDKPIRNARVRVMGEGQPEVNVTTDKEGRFQFKVCEGNVYIYAYAQGGYGEATIEAGGTNAVIQILPYGRDRTVVEKTVSMKGKPRPDLSTVGISTESLPTGEPLLICLFDLEQRPSRRSVRLLNEQYESLKAKGVAVVAVQAAPVSDQALDEWKNSSPVSFPIGRVREKSPSTKWASSTQSLPWLILVDSDGKVAADGFGMDELEARLAELEK